MALSWRPVALRKIAAARARMLSGVKGAGVPFCVR